MLASSFPLTIDLFHEVFQLSRLHTAFHIILHFIVIADSKRTAVVMTGMLLFVWLFLTSFGATGTDFVIDSSCCNKQNQKLVSAEVSS